MVEKQNNNIIRRGRKIFNTYIIKRANHYSYYIFTL